MSQYQGIFQRYEKKYLLNRTQYQNLSRKLESHMREDQYGKSTICNIYYDTPDHRLIRESMEKPIYKEKLRLRSYGVPKKEDIVFVELKKKYKGVVYKRRVNMPLAEAEKWLERRECRQASQIGKEIDRAFDFYQGLAPAMVLSYDRIALLDKDDPDLRITFDSQILWRKSDLSLQAGVWGQPLLEDGQRLMEIKIAGSMPMWLVQMLDEEAIYQISFSKYGSAYQASCRPYIVRKSSKYA